MAPHGIYPAIGEDGWIAIACRDEADWTELAKAIDEPWAADPALATLAGRLAGQGPLDDRIAAWTRGHDATTLAATLQAAGVPATRVQTPQQRIDQDPDTAAWGLWPEVEHKVMGGVRVDGLPVRLSESDWRIERGAPVLGQHNDIVFGDLLGMPEEELAELRREGVI